MDMQAQLEFVEDVEVRGHIIDSLMLPKILDLINSTGGRFQIRSMHVGQRREDPSHALYQATLDLLEKQSPVLF